VTWSYSGNPASSDTDAVRFLVGDTDTTDQLISNEEINYTLSVYNEPAFAAIAAARSIAAKFARQSDQSRSVGDLSLSESFSQKSQQYQHLADHLSGLANSAALPPIPVANANALGAEFTIGLLDKYTL
jgi:hypothetical protein